MSAPPLPRLIRPASPKPGTGQVHLGIGAFFRAHAALYTAEAMALSGGDWGVVGVSLKTPRMRDQLAGQGWAYTALELAGEASRCQTLDVLNAVLFAPEDPERVLRAMADPGVRIVSLTVTEKGYCLNAGTGRLDREHDDIRHDLSSSLPRSAPGFVVRALQMRRDAGVAPFTVMSLDNLPANGVSTRRAVLDLATVIDPDLAAWIDAEGAFPSTMVDRIVPATTPEVIADVAALTGVHDEAPVAHEPFRQWVIEDDFVGGARPDWGAVGAEIVPDVSAFEHMKLRMLNGTHSALAYLGSLAGYRTVAEAVGDPVVVTFIRALWSREIALSFTPPASVDLAAYSDRLVARYANPGIAHKLEQIAADGSQKLPQRILAPIADLQARGHACRGLILVLAGWFRYAAGYDDTGRALHLSDPLAGRLQDAVQGRPTWEGRMRAALDMEEVFGGVDTDEFAPTLLSLLEQLDRAGARATMKDMAQ